MKKFVLVSLLMTCLPFLLAAQTNDDLYFIPKKKTEKKVTSGTPAKVVIEKDQAPTTVYASPGSTVVVKDANGDLRDVDEYNRRYTSRDNTPTSRNSIRLSGKSSIRCGPWLKPMSRHTAGTLCWSGWSIPNARSSSGYRGSTIRDRYR